MALGNSTFTDIGSAANDIFSSEATAGGLRIQAQGATIQGQGAVIQGEATDIAAGGTTLQGQGEAITASGTRITGQSQDITAEGTDIQSQASLLEAQGNIVEGTNYTEAADLATQNEAYTAESTGIQETQADRQIYQGIGTEKAGYAGAGLAEGGSAIDVLASSASQGAIQKAIVGNQGLITEAGFEEQAQSYKNLAAYAVYGASVETNVAGEQTGIATDQRNLATGYDSIADAQDTLAGGYTDLATSQEKLVTDQAGLQSSYDQIASSDDSLANSASTNGDISAGISGAAALATLFIA